MRHLSLISSTGWAQSVDECTTDDIDPAPFSIIDPENEKNVKSSITCARATEVIDTFTDLVVPPKPQSTQYISRLVCRMKMPYKVRSSRDIRI